jgi:hypothetical protein
MSNPSFIHRSVLFCILLHTTLDIWAEWSPEQVSLAAPELVVLEWVQGGRAGGLVVPYEAEAEDRRLRTAQGEMVLRDHEVLGVRKGSAPNWLYRDEKFVPEQGPGENWLEAGSWSVQLVRGEAAEEV